MDSSPIVHESFSQEKTESLQAISQGCERKWNRLKLLQAYLGEVSESLSCEVQQNAPCQADKLALLKEKVKRLEAELSLLKEKELETLPENDEMQQLILQQENREHIQQLNETLAFVRAKRTELTESISKEKKMGNQLKTLNATLKGKVDLLNSRLQSEEGNASASTSTEQILDELQREITKMSSVDRSYKKTVIKLLNEHFPLPSELDDPKKTKNILNDSRAYDVHQLCPVSSIVGRLVEQTLNSPNDPYIDIDDTMWPPHIEFLLRSQIVRKDPKNSSRVKLCAFHF